MNPRSAELQRWTPTAAAGAAAASAAALKAALHDAEPAPAIEQPSQPPLGAGTAAAAQQRPPAAPQSAGWRCPSPAQPTCAALLPQERASLAVDLAWLPAGPAAQPAALRAAVAVSDGAAAPRWTPAAAGLQAAHRLPPPRQTGAAPPCCSRCRCCCAPQPPVHLYRRRSERSPATCEGWTGIRQRSRGQAAVRPAAATCLRSGRDGAGRGCGALKCKSRPPGCHRKQPKQTNTGEYGFLPSQARVAGPAQCSCPTTHRPRQTCP